ncbi:hypothetical protein [Vibrio mediterranei]|uniref:hypothetical protein n=1 Tax=Vibrio mediterranei TaxID=689 RepID=UPI00148C24EB|nr:hypothetical protein [Vibrio mediterranei]NOH31747.1 hypothetical protein [Vibrio mediterranei]
MSRVLLLFGFLFHASGIAASQCTTLINNHVYNLDSGVEYCLESEYQYTYISYFDEGTSMLEISNFEKSQYVISYPGEISKVPDKFRITAFNKVQLVVNEGVIYIKEQPKRRSKRSVGTIVKAAGSAAAGQLGVAVSGGQPSPGPAIIGSVIGTSVGLATGPLAPVVAPFVSAAITTNIERNKDKPRPPLTRISTSRGLNTSGMRAYAAVKRGNSCSGCH